jgi:hypothetical protein
MGTKKVSPTLKVLVEIRDELRTTRSEMPSRNPMRVPEIVAAVFMLTIAGWAGMMDHSLADARRSRTLRPAMTPHLRRH